MGCCASHTNKIQPIRTIATPTTEQYQRRISTLVESSAGNSKARYGRRNSFVMSKSIEFDPYIYEDAKMIAAINEYATKMASA